MAVNNGVFKASKKLEERHKQAGEAADRAEQAAHRVSARKPSEPLNRYVSVSNELLNEYLNRKPYEYNINTDSLYAQYADQYKRQAKRAMRDASSEAASKTGGYGSSYGEIAAASAYQSYLDKLNSIVPELEKRAAQRYNDANSQYKDKLSTVNEASDRDYARYRDRIADYQRDRDYYNDKYEFERKNEMSYYDSLLDYIMKLADLENNDYYKMRTLQNNIRKLDMDEKKLYRSNI